MGKAKTYIRSIVVIPDIRDEIYPHTESLIKLLKDTGCNVRKFFPVCFLKFLSLTTQFYDRGIMCSSKIFLLAQIG